MKKVLCPISGWQFFITVFTVFALFNPLTWLLFVYCTQFLQITLFSIVYYIAPIIMCIILPRLVVLFAAFKRLIDIYGNTKKAFIITVLAGFCWFYVLFVLLKPVLNFYETSDNFTEIINYQADSTHVFCHFIICAVFFIFLVFTEGLNRGNKLNIKTILKRILLTILIFFIPCIISRTFYLFNWMPIADFKMVPTIDMNDSLLAYKNFKHETLKRFDVVTVSSGDLDLFNTPIRIIGLPGEKVEIKDNKIYINDELIEDKYAFYGEKLMPLNINKTIILDNDSFFLMGDNRYYQKGGKYLSKNMKTNKEEWHDVPLGELNSYTVSKDKITGKIVAINYKDYREKSDIKRNKTGVKILFKNKTPEHNPSQFSLYLFGKNTKKAIL